MKETDPLDFSSPIKEYRPGDIMTCAIQSKLPGGYALRLPNKDLRVAFLPTSLAMNTDEEVEVFYVCTDGRKIFLSMTEEEFKRRMKSRATRFGQPSK